MYPGAEGSNRKKINEICGLDGRVRWSDAEFEQWRDSALGTHAIAVGRLPDEQPAPKKEEQGEEMDTTGDSDEANAA